MAPKNMASQTKRILIDEKGIPKLVQFGDWPAAVVISKPGASIEVKQVHLPALIRKAISDGLERAKEGTGGGYGLAQ